MQKNSYIQRNVPKESLVLTFAYQTLRKLKKNNDHSRKKLLFAIQGVPTSFVTNIPKLS